MVPEEQPVIKSGQRLINSDIKQLKIRQNHMQLRSDADIKPIKDA